MSSHKEMIHSNLITRVLASSLLRVVPLRVLVIALHVHVKALHALLLVMFPHVRVSVELLHVDLTFMSPHAVSSIALPHVDF